MQRQHRIRLFLVTTLLVLLFINVPTKGSALQADSLRFDPVSVTAELYSNGTTHVSFRALVNNQGSSSILTISIRIDSVQVYLESTLVEDEPAPATLSIQERYSVIIIQLDSPLAVGETVWIHLSLTMYDLQSEAGVSSSGDATLSDFIFYFRPISTYSNISLIVILPPEALLSQQSVTPLFPQASSNFTDGASIAFVWNLDLLQSGQEKVFIIRYQVPLSEVTVAGFGLELFIISIALLGIGLVLGFFGPRMISRIKEIGRVRIVGITSEEEEVMDALRAKGGSCPQKDLYRDLDMSQSKISIILTALEERGLVRRFKDGRENIVHIIEE